MGPSDGSGTWVDFGGTPVWSEAFGQAGYVGQIPNPTLGPGTGVGSQQEAINPAMSPSRETTTYPVLQSGD